MSFLNKVDLNYRPKAYFSGNKFTKQIIYNKSAFISYKPKVTSLSYYFEFNYSQVNVTDLESSLLSSITALGISLTNITTKIINSVSTGIIIVHNISSSLPTSSNEYDIAADNLAILRSQILNTFSLSFKDINDVTVLGVARINLESDGYHKQVYRYNEIYKFLPSSNPDLFPEKQFKFTNASDSTSTSIKSGDKVWVINSSNQYLTADLSDDKKSYNSDTIEFLDDTKTDTDPWGKRMLFEIHGFDKIEMDSSNEIAEGKIIPDDYGFKLEILPPSIKSLFTGLSDFVPGSGYSFTADSTWTFMNVDDDSIANFNTSVFYNQELLGSVDTGLPDIVYSIDECFLTYNGTIFGFTYDNDFSDSKVFFNATELS